MKALSLPKKAKKLVLPTPEETAPALWQKLANAPQNQTIEEEFWQKYEVLIAESKVAQIEASYKNSIPKAQIHHFSICPSLQKKRWKQAQQEEMAKVLPTFLKAMFVCNFPLFFLNFFVIGVLITLVLILFFLSQLLINLHTASLLLKAEYEISPQGVVQYTKGKATAEALHQDIAEIKTAYLGIHLLKANQPAPALHIPYDIDDFHQAEKLLLHYAAVQSTQPTIVA